MFLSFFFIYLFVYMFKNYWTVFNKSYINRFLDTRGGFVTLIYGRIQGRDSGDICLRWSNFVYIYRGGQAPLKSSVKIIKILKHNL